MEVPHDIHAERIEAHRLQHQDAVLPVLLGNPCEVDLA